MIIIEAPLFTLLTRESPSRPSYGQALVPSKIRLETKDRVSAKKPTESACFVIESYSSSRRSFRLSEALITLSVLLI